MATWGHTVYYLQSLKMKFSVLCFHFSTPNQIFIPAHLIPHSSLDVLLQMLKCVKSSLQQSYFIFSHTCCTQQDDWRVMCEDTNDTIPFIVTVIVLQHCKVPLSSLLNCPKLVQVDICVCVSVCFHAYVCVGEREKGLPWNRHHITELSILSSSYPVAPPEIVHKHPWVWLNRRK